VTPADQESAPDVTSSLRGRSSRNHSLGLQQSPWRSQLRWFHPPDIMVGKADSAFFGIGDTDLFNSSIARFLTFAAAHAKMDPQGLAISSHRWKIHVVSDDIVLDKIIARSLPTILRRAWRPSSQVCPSIGSARPRDGSRPGQQPHQRQPIDKGFTRTASPQSQIFLSFTSLVDVRPPPGTCPRPWRINA